MQGLCICMTKTPKNRAKRYWCFGQKMLKFHSVSQKSKKGQGQLRPCSKEIAKPQPDPLQRCHHR